MIISEHKVAQQPWKSLFIKSQTKLKQREGVPSLGEAGVRSIDTVEQLKILEWLI